MLPFAKILCRFVVFIACISASTTAFAITLQNSKGVKQRSESDFQIVKPDPYFTVKLNGQKQLNETSWMILPITIQTDKDVVLTPKIGVYFNPVKQTKNFVFSPLHRFQFYLPLSEQLSSIAFAIPPKLNIHNSYVRIDIDKCHHCKVSFSGTPRISREAPKSAHIVNDLRLINGARKLPDNGVRLEVQNWRPKDIEFKDELAVVTSDDPFLISKIIDVSTADLGGVLVSLVPPTTESNIYNFQLFYGTESHEFTERASSILRLAGNKDNAKDPIQFFIPLNFIANQHPPKKILTKLRFDLPGKMTETNEIWNINSIEVIHKNQASQYQDLIPPQLIHFKFQRASAKQVIDGIINKITSDIWFTLFFLILLIAWIAGCFRLYVKSRKSA